MRATAWNQKTIDEFHAKQGLGVGMWGDHVLLMTAKGAKSGEPITTPLVCGREGEHFVIVASKGGAPTNPTWFHNIKTNPEVEVEVAKPGGGVEKFKARARVVEDRAERGPDHRSCEIDPKRVKVAGDECGAERPHGVHRRP